MSATEKEPVVRSSAGDLLGRWDDGVAGFRGVPYALPPVGARRFSPPAPMPRWDGVRPAVAPAMAPPQPASRADLIMGPLEAPGMDEDCLTLNVWTAAPSANEKLPVLVWFHGGGFMFGGGAAPWYDGTVMARRGRVVVVSVNYRLGALGYLYLPAGVLGEKPVVNLGLQDQCLALQWVQENIAAFGGDPGQVTVAGQSAGGLSIIGLSAMPRAAGLFHRRILQSGGLSVPANSLETASKVTDAFLQAAGVAAGDGEALLALSTAQILAAQDKALMTVTMSGGIDPRLRPASMAPFQLAVDGEILPVQPVTAARQGSMDDGDMLLMVTAEEMQFAYAMDEAFWTRDRDSILDEVRRAWGDEGVAVFETYAAVDPAKPAPKVLSDMLSEEGAVATIEIAERRARVGRPAYFAWFSWRSKGLGGRIGAAHTAELPFVFNNFHQWSKSPIIEGADPAELKALGDRMQDAWIAFIRTGVPGAGWPPYAPPERAAMEFGAHVGLIRDPAPNRTAEGITFRTR